MGANVHAPAHAGALVSGTGGIQDVQSHGPLLRHEAEGGMIQDAADVILGMAGAFKSAKRHVDIKTRPPRASGSVW